MNKACLWRLYSFVCCVLLAHWLYQQRQTTTRLSIETASLIIVQAMPIAAVFSIVLFPRFEAPNWMLLNEVHQAKTGLTIAWNPDPLATWVVIRRTGFQSEVYGSIAPPSNAIGEGRFVAYRWQALDSAKGTKFGRFWINLFLKGRLIIHTYDGATG